MEMTNTATDRLADLLDERLSLSQSLLELAAQQTVALTAEDVSAFESLLQQKQELMDSIDRFDQKFAPIWAEIHEQSGVANWNDLARRQPESTLLAKREAIASCLGELMQIDAEHDKLSRQLLTKLEQELQVVNRSATASRTYAQTSRESGVPALFANRKL